MNKPALYRKYRPQRFSDIVGQQHVTRTLLNAVSTQRIAHAYLFSGPRGCGKTTAARILTKAINCEDDNDPEPCNECSSCKDIREGRAVDLTEIDAASHRGIDEIRELREGVLFSPARMRYKVFILDEAHQLTSGAANALLKMLEEAPSHVIFILATTEPQKMISTIISRCQRFDFRKLTVPEIIERLRGIAKEEGYRAEDEALRLIALAAGGALRDAESLLSQVLSFVSEGNIIGKEEVKELLGVMEKGAVGDFVDCLLKKDGKGALELMDEVFDQGMDPEDFYHNLMHYLREMMIFCTIEKREGSFMESLLAVFTEEEAERMEAQVRSTENEEIRRMVDVFLEAGRRMNYSPIPQLPLETAVAELIKDSE